MLTLLGFVILIGIVVNNAILLVHQTLLHIKDEGMNVDAAILEATRNRIRPIFMSTLTSVCGMLPLVLFPGAGSELYRGLGSVVVGGLALMFLSGMHLHLLATLAGFYDVWPIGARPAAGDLALWIAGHVSETFVLAFRLAVPFVILSMLYNVTLGVINKAMPQLMVSFVGAPVITLGGLMLLALSAPYMLGLWQAALARFLSHPLGAG